MNYKFFQGKVIDQMPILLSEGYVPLGPKEIFTEQMREKFRDDIWYDTNVVIAQHPDNEIKIIPNNVALLAEYIIPGRERENGAIILGPDEYERIPSRFQYVNSIGSLPSRMKREEAKQHPLLKALLESSCEELVNSTFDRMKEEFNQVEGMGFMFSSPSKSPTLRLLCLEPLTNGCTLSTLYHDVDFDKSMLVGRKPVQSSSPYRGFYF